MGLKATGGAGKSFLASSRGLQSTLCVRGHSHERLPHQCAHLENLETLVIGQPSPPGSHDPAALSPDSIPVGWGAFCITRTVPNPLATATTLRTLQWSTVGCPPGYDFCGVLEFCGRGAASCQLHTPASGLAASPVLSGAVPSANFSVLVDNKCLRAGRTFCISWSYSFPCTLFFVSRCLRFAAFLG